MEPDRSVYAVVPPLVFSTRHRSVHQTKEEFSRSKNEAKLVTLSKEKIRKGPLELLYSIQPLAAYVSCQIFFDVSS